MRSFFEKPAVIREVNDKVEENFRNFLDDLLDELKAVFRDEDVKVM